MSGARPKICFHCSTCVCSPVFDSLLSACPALSPSLRRDLLAELQELHICVASLKGRVIDAMRQHNSTIPISRLPPEILGEIFLYARDTSLDRQWMAVSQTHHAWRAVAVSQRSLWSVLDLSYSERTFREMASRTKGLPLTMAVSSGGRRRSLGPSSLKRQLSIWDTLDVTNGARFSFTAPSLSVIAIILPRISASAAHVQAIELFTPSGCDLDLTPEVIGAQYPRLTTLRLGQHSILDWRSSLYTAPNLRVLSIVGDGSDPPYLFEPVAAALRLLPRLEELKLHRCLPWKGIRDSPGPAASEQFTLPQLAMLDLMGRPQSCVRLCQYLQLPPTCRTRIWCTKRCYPGEQRPLIDLTLSSPARLHGGYLEGENEAKIFASMDYTSGNAFRYLHVPKPWEYGNDYYDDIMQEFGRAIANVGSDSLSLIPVDLDCETSPWSGFGGSSQARVIHIDWTLAGGFASGAEFEEVGEYFSKMEILVLEGVDLDSEDLCRSNMFTDLAWRSKTYGNPRKLQLVDCEISDEVLGSFRLALPAMEVEVMDGGVRGCWARRMSES